MMLIGRVVCDISSKRLVLTAHHVLLEPNTEPAIRLVATDNETRRVFLLYMRSSELSGDPEKSLHGLKNRLHVRYH